MIPMLAWIARQAPKNRKATYFAVMAAFTNLALSASHLGAQYLNDAFVIQREQYDELGMLMISVALLGLIVPVIAVLLFKPSDRSAVKPLMNRQKGRPCHLCLNRFLKKAQT